MLKRFRRLALGILVLVAIFFLLVPALVERALNGPAPSSAFAGITPEAQKLHSTLRIADLHADSLLWGRDLLARGTRGAVDVPRLIEGHVALEVFTAVTKTPRGLNYVRNKGDSDNILWLALAQRWPPRTWSSLTERALFLSDRFQKTAAASGGRLAPIRTASDLRNYLAPRQQDRPALRCRLPLHLAHAFFRR